MARATAPRAAAANGLFVECWGGGEPVVLVHGSLATGADEWQLQRPLATEGFLMKVPDRRGYGRSPRAEGEDFVADARDIAALMGEGAHLVGHSYGGLSAMLAAAAHPRRTLSLTLLEPAAFGFGQGSPAARALLAALRAGWDRALPDREWALWFLEAVGSDPASLSEDLIEAAVALVGLFRAGRPAWTADLPLAALAAADYPRLVVSGGHHAGFEAICDELGAAIGAERRVIAGAGHEIQFTGAPLNAVLRNLWRGAARRRQAA